MQYSVPAGLAQRAWRGAVVLATGFAVSPEIRWNSVTRVIFLCKGNVCRSAYAQQFALSQGLLSLSAGIDTHGGIPANDVAKRIASARGVDLSSHRSVKFSDLVGGLRCTDLVVAMEPWQARIAQASSSSIFRSQLTLAGLWLPVPKATIVDPYGKHDQVFTRVFDELDSVVVAVARLIGRGTPEA